MMFPPTAFTNQNTKNSEGTDIDPIVFAPVKENVEPEKAVAAAASPLTLVFPSSFDRAPTSEPSDVPTVTFIASLYCPSGIRRSSRSLFIIPATRLLFNSIT